MLRTRQCVFIRGPLDGEVKEIPAGVTVYKAPGRPGYEHLYVSEEYTNRDGLEMFLYRIERRKT